MDRNILRQIPFVRLVIPLIIGILFFSYVKAITALPFIWIAPVFPLVIIILRYLQPSFTQRWTLGLFVYPALIFAGLAIAQSHHQPLEKDIEQILLTEAQFYYGYFTSAPTTKKRINGFFQVIAHGKTAHHLTSKSFKLWLSFPKDSIAETLEAKAHILIKLRAQKCKPPSNPGDFSFQSFLKRKQIALIAYPTSDSIFYYQKPANTLFIQIAQYRKQLTDQLTQLLPTKREQAIAQALILGERSSMDQNIQQAYAKVGAVHVLAVSGLHVGLVFGFLFFFCQKIKSRSIWSQLFKSVFLLLGIWFYAFLAGASPSVLRAATMFSFIILGHVVNRSINIYNSLAGSALVLLCIDPSLLFQVGFQLSYFAVLGIVYFYPIFKAYWFSENPILNWVYSLLLVSVSAQLSTLPLCLFYFHQFPLLFWASSLVVIPLTTIILPLGIIVLFLHSLPYLGYGLVYLFIQLLTLMNDLIFQLNLFPFAVISNIKISLIGLILGYLLLIYFAHCLFIKRLNKIWIPISILVILGCVYSYKQWQWYQRNEGYVFHYKDQTLFGFIRGKTSYFFYDKKRIESMQEDALLQSLHIDESHFYSLDSMVQLPFLRYENGIGILPQFTFVYLPKITSKLPKEANVMIAGKAPLKLPPKYPVRCVVADGQRGYFERKKWKDWAVSQNIHFHQTQNEGAYYFKLNEKKIQK